jgi:hypothetical protein
VMSLCDIVSHSSMSLMLASALHLHSKVSCGSLIKMTGESFLNIYKYVYFMLVANCQFLLISILTNRNFKS